MTTACRVVCTLAVFGGAFVTSRRWLSVGPVTSSRNLSPAIQVAPTVRALPARAADRAEAERTVQPDIPKPSGRALDEYEVAKVIIEANAGWLYDRSPVGDFITGPDGKRFLSPAGRRYAQYVLQAEAAGVSGPINQHVWAVTKVVDELRERNQLAESPVTRVRNPLAVIEGGLVIAADGTYLGRVTWNELVPDSILNGYGRWVRQEDCDKFFTGFTAWGGYSGIYSPFNRSSSSPPRIVTRNGDFVAYFTVAESYKPRIDPYVLIAFLGGR
jgi:hypothetical protein